MITTERKKNLTDAYMIIRDNAGWLRHFEEAGYTTEELVYLENLDDELGRYQPEKEADIFFKVRPRNLRPSSKFSGQLPEWKVTKAREFPLEKLVSPNRANKIHCPFDVHEGDTMWVKNGFGFCFSCGASCDSIKWLMTVDGYTFVQAVERLS